VSSLGATSDEMRPSSPVLASRQKALETRRASLSLQVGGGCARPAVEAAAQAAAAASSLGVVNLRTPMQLLSSPNMRTPTTAATTTTTRSPRAFGSAGGRTMGGSLRWTGSGGRSGWIKKAFAMRHSLDVPDTPQQFGSDLG
jgi:hypothetical protein